MKNIEISEIADLPTKYGLFKAQVFNDGSKDHILLRMGDIGGAPPLVRVHSECLTGDAFFSRKCDCGEQLAAAFEMIAQEGRGMVIYLRQEGRDIGLFNKINAYALQDRGLDTIEANHQLGFADDLRSYEIAEYILNRLEIKTIRLITNNPKKIGGFKSVEIAERVPLIVKANDHNRAYLRAKKEKSGHLL